MPDSTTTTTTENSPTDDLDWELREYRLGVQTLYLRDGAEETALYKTAGRTQDAEEMAAHDGPVILEGTLCRVVEEGYIETYHPHGGKMAAPRLSRRSDTEAVLLREVPRTDV